MFNITVLSIGKIKEKYFQEAANEYLKRLSPYGKIIFEELKSEPFKNNGDKEKSKTAEGERIIKYLNKFSASRVIILDENGREFTSVEFSKLLAQENSHLILVIGGALGLSKEVLNYPTARKLSLSKMTYPHELARVVLTEQIYRAVTIMKGKEYHY